MTGGTLRPRLPTRAVCVLTHGTRPAGHRGVEWLKAEVTKNADQRARAAAGTGPPGSPGPPDATRAVDLPTQDRDLMSPDQRLDILGPVVAGELDQHPQDLPGTVLARADDALSRAKLAGRNRVVSYGQQM